MAYRRRTNCRFVPTVVKIANADCVCSGAQRAPCRLAMITAQIQRRKASRFVIARSEATWQSRSIRPDHRALPANTVTLRGIVLRTPPSTRRVRSAIMPPNLGPARRSGNAATPHTLAFAILTIACTGGRCVAGRGVPRPYFFTHTGAADKCPSPRRKQADFRGKSFKKLLHSGYFSVIIRTIYSRLY